MTERPILFSGQMVDAIFAGRKTQTRRVVRWPFKGQPHADELDNLGDGQSLYIRRKAVACPYGIPGDRLWVREAFAKTTVLGKPWIVYRVADTRTDYGGPWKPGIHMPRTACRLVLEVTDMRCERLQDITNRDAIAEGETGTSGYRLLWDDLNEKRGFGWNVNPWVWVMDFKRA